MRLSEVIDDLYDRVLGCQDALQNDEPVYDEPVYDEDDEYEEEDYFPEDEE